MLNKIYDYLVRRNFGLVEPFSAETVPSYNVSFSAASRFSRHIARNTPDMHLNGSTLSSERLGDALRSALRTSGANSRHMEGAVGQCAKFAHFFAPFIEQSTGLKAWPTLGQLWKGDRRLFGPTWDDLQVMLRRGVQVEDVTGNGRQGLNWHSWITLESGVVIDMTFPSTLAKLFPDKFGELEGVIAADQESNVFSDHRFFPMLTGAPAIERLESRSCIQFLARSVEDLSSYNQLLVLTPQIG